MTGLRPLLTADPRRTVAVAESLTCGRLQARIGAESGASDYFLGGMTAYSVDQKVRHLGVDRAEAAASNGVSASVAEQMACGACRLFGSDFGISTTGYAEPSPDGRVAAPFAWWGLARRSPSGAFETTSGRVELPGLPRTEVQERVAAAACEALVSWIRGPAAARKP